MGAVINMEPPKFYGVIAAVTFMDVITTLLDETIPLTTGEYDEWGNANIKEHYDYNLSYLPYDNVDPRNFPQPSCYQRAAPFAGTIQRTGQMGRPNTRCQ